MPRCIMLPLTRDEALKLLNEKIKSPYTIKHCLATEAIMRGLAERSGEDKELWGIAGLLHDLDLEEVKGDMNNHGKLTAQILKEKNFPPPVINAILAHNGDVLQIECEEKIDFALTAGESISGLIVATALIMPSKKLSDVKASSVIKRMKEKRFAANVSRERISKYKGLGLSLEEFSEICLLAMQAIADELGL